MYKREAEVLEEEDTSRTSKHVLLCSSGPAEVFNTLQILL
jgi:hypothetical protein